MNPIQPLSPAASVLIELDCRTQQCPLPVLRLAKATRELGLGGCVRVRADDPAFPKDLRAWARSAGARIVRFEERGDHYEAVIRVGDDGTLGPEPAAWLEPVDHGRGPAHAAPEPEPEPVPDCSPDLGDPEPEPPGLGPVHQTFDLRQQPARARLELIARACERAEPGAILAVIADDPHFGERVDGLLQTIDATLLGYRHRDGAVEVRIRVEPPLARPQRAPAGGSGQPSARAHVTTPARVGPASLAPQPSPAASARTGTLLLARPAPRIAPEPPELPEQPDALDDRGQEDHPPEPDRCTLLLLHNDHEALLAALLVATGAAAQGMHTSVFFSFWALNLLRGDRPNLAEPPAQVSVMQRVMKWMMPRGPARQPLGQMHFAGLGKGMLASIMREQQLMSLPELLASAEQLGVRFTACTMSMSVMGISARDLHPYPNLDYGGVASFVADARRSAIQLVF